jgi:RNA polymerase sigma-70 factor (ECF subfamily)
MISNREISEDIAQEVMLRYWTKFRERDCHKLAKGYLYQSAYHAAIDYLRREKVERKRLHSYLSRQKDFEMIEDLMTQREIQRGINRVMNGLPKKCREVFQLSREEGLSYGQIALRMSISIKTVETQMSKALKRFRTELSRVY